MPIPTLRHAPHPPSVFSTLAPLRLERESTSANFLYGLPGYGALFGVKKMGFIAIGYFMKFKIG
jgi:hypothetical protein